MTLSTSLITLAESGTNPGEWYSLYEACDKEGFDLDDFLFQIWKDTLNDY
jgi:hypothetical protein